MRLHVDLDTLRLVASPLDRNPASVINLKRGDFFETEIRFLRAGSPVRLASDTVVTLAAKKKNDYAAPLVVLQNTFATSAVTDPDSDPHWTGGVNLSTAGLDTLFATNPAIVELMAEITWKAPAATGPATVLTFALQIHNDVYRGDETTPLILETPEEWIADRSDPKTISGAPVNAIDKGIMTVAGALTDYDNAAVATPIVLTQSEALVEGRARYAASGGHSIEWNGTAWELELNGALFSFLSSEPANPSTPDLVTTWVAEGGATGTPTVTPSTSPSTAGVLGSERVDGDTMWKVVAIVDGQPVWRAMASKLTGELDYLDVAGNGNITGLLVSGAAFILANADVGGTLAVTGATTMASASVTGALSIGGQLEATAQALANADRVVTRGLGDARYKTQYTRQQSDLVITSSATLADTDLVATLEAGKKYRVKAFLHLVGTVNTGTRQGVTYSGSATARMFRSRNSNLPAINFNGNLELGLEEATTIAYFEGVYEPSTGGTLKIQAAQNTSHADEMKVLTYSHLLVEEL